MGLSPLITRDGRPLVRAAPGWRRSVEPGRTRVEDGPYRVVVSWVGDEGFRAAARLAECLENGRLARGEQAEITYEALTPEPAWGFEARLLTPAQWSFRDAMGRRLVLRCPSPSRLLKPALEYLYRGEEYERAARLVDWHTGVTGGELRPVTVSIDRERSTAWAVQGWI